MITAAHFTRVRIGTKPKYKFTGNLKHKECNTVVTSEFQADSFSDLTWTFSYTCPTCKTLGGTGQWDSVPKQPSMEV